MWINNYDDAEHEFWAMEQDAKADFGDEVEIEWRDLVVSVCFNIPPAHDEVARELCRTKLGYVPHELVGRLGELDWVQ